MNLISFPSLWSFKGKNGTSPPLFHFLDYFYFLCMCILLAYMLVDHMLTYMHMYHNSEAGKCVGSTETGFTDGCEPTSGFWKSNPGLLEEKLVLFTSDPSPQSLIFLYWSVSYNSGEGSCMLVRVEPRRWCWISASIVLYHVFSK